MTRRKADRITGWQRMKRVLADAGKPEVFTALFDLEMAGRVRQLPTRNYVWTM